LDIFGFAPYEERKIARYDDVHGNYISTAYVHDSSDPIETGIHYRPWGDRVIIVQSYKTKDEALVAHERYVELMKSDKLPLETPDNAGTNVFAELLRLIK